MTSVAALSPLTLCAGDALMTVATGQLSGGQAERAGLVPTHAYAVLNVVMVKVSLCLQPTFQLPMAACVHPRLLPGTEAASAQEPVEPQEVEGGCGCSLSGVLMSLLHC